jgi:hypothetical protein
VVTETFAKPLSLIASSGAAYVIKKLIKGNPDWHPKAKFAEEVVWIIYFQIINLFAIVYSPYFALV